jgi:hypothetical protein
MDCTVKCSHETNRFDSNGLIFKIQQLCELVIAAQIQKHFDNMGFLEESTPLTEDHLCPALERRRFTFSQNSKKQRQCDSIKRLHAALEDLKNLLNSFLQKKHRGRPRCDLRQRLQSSFADLHVFSICQRQ